MGVGRLAVYSGGGGGGIRGSLGAKIVCRTTGGGAWQGGNGIGMGVGLPCLS